MLAWFRGSRQRKLDAALFAAVYDEDPAAVSQALAEGATPDARREDRQTPLMRAASEGQAAIARLLLDHGADVNAQSETGETALLLAVQPEFGAEPSLDEMGLHGPSAAATEPEDDADNALFAAAPAEPPADDLAPETGTSSRGHGGGSPEFDQAVFATGQLLLSRGATIDLADREGNTPLIKAALDGRLDFVCALLQAGANPGAANRQGVTALIAAGAGSRVDLVQALLTAGGDANAATGEGLTALMLAAARGQAAVVQALLAAGADAGHADVEGRTAADLARAGGNLDLAEVLASPKGSSDEPPR
jgi:serine/threonine-protein phosphatase 6 regulatory ankyrin repeat subunit B